MAKVLTDNLVNLGPTSWSTFPSLACLNSPLVEFRDKKFKRRFVLVCYVIIKMPTCPFILPEATEDVQSPLVLSMLRVELKHVVLVTGYRVKKSLSTTRFCCNI